MAYPPLSYKSSELSPAELELSKLATNPLTEGSALQLLPGAAALRRGAAADAQDAYRQDLALAIAKQNEETRSNMATELGTGLNSTNPQALPLMAQLDPTRGIFSSGGGRGINANVAALVDASTRGRAREQDAGVQEKYASALKSNVESGYTTPPDVAAGQLGYQPNMNDPLQLRVVAAHEQAANMRHAADMGKLNQPMVSSKFDPITNKITYEGMPGDIQGAAGRAAVIANLNLKGQPPPILDAAGKVIGFDTAKFEQPATIPIKNKRGEVIGTRQVDLGAGYGQPSPTASAGAALPLARNSSAPPSSSVKPDQSAAPATQAPAATPPAPSPQQGASRVQLPTNAPQDQTYTPDAHPNINLASHLMDQYHKNVLAAQQFDANIKAAVALSYEKGRYTMGKGQDGKPYLLVNGQAVAPVGR